MKKLFYTFFAALVISLSFNPVLASASAKVPNKELSTEQKEQLQRITQRVEEIKSMDRSQLSREERKALRKELREMERQARPMAGGGVYLSVGAIIIIILVLIILL